jgi:hypothetical protein
MHDIGESRDSSNKAFELQGTFPYHSYHFRIFGMTEILPRFGMVDTSNVVGGADYRRLGNR